MNRNSLPNQGHVCMAGSLGGGWKCVWRGSSTATLDPVPVPRWHIQASRLAVPVTSHMQGKLHLCLLIVLLKSDFQGSNGLEHLTVRTARFPLTIIAVCICPYCMLMESACLIKLELGDTCVTQPGTSPQRC